MNRCYRCTQPLQKGEKTIHESCKKAFWPVEQDFVLPFTKEEVANLAKENVMARVTVPGVQPKISLAVSGDKNTERVTIVGALEGDYILKPPHDDYPELPEIEALSMHLAQACGIRTVPFSLIPFKSGELAYLTKRIDRINGRKIAMEDFCQLTERMTEHKYRGSHELVSKVIKKYAMNNLIEVVHFYEIVLASYLMGNADMHLKNFSLIKENKIYRLSPAYDMITTKLLMPNDQEELALTLNGKRNNLNRKDFEIAMIGAGFPIKAIQNLFKRVLKGVEKWQEIIENSFISKEKQKELTFLIQERKRQLTKSECD